MKKVIIWVLTILVIAFCVIGLKLGWISQNRIFKVIFVIGMYLSWAINSLKDNKE